VKHQSRRGDHSSGRRIAAPLKRPTRGSELIKLNNLSLKSIRAGRALPSYLALHHAGFAMPPMSPPGRWALTPPFHPYLHRDSWKTTPRFCL